MDIGQPWAAIASGVVGLVVAGAAVSGWWSARLGRARRLIEQLKASRDLLNQQNSQARRQIEHLQLELGELRIIAERVRRRAANTISPEESLGPPLDPRPVLPMMSPVVSLSDRAPGAAPGFIPTQLDEPEDNSGFAPTQIDRSRGR